MVNVKYSIYTQTHWSSEKGGMSLRTLQRGSETSSGFGMMDRISTSGEEAGYFRNQEGAIKETGRELKERI